MLPLLKLPVAVSCSWVPFGIEEPGGVIVIEVKVSGVTVSVAEPWTPAKVQETEVLPTPVPVITFRVGDASLTCTIPVLPEVQLV